MRDFEIRNLKLITLFSEGHGVLNGTLQAKNAHNEIRLFNGNFVCFNNIVKRFMNTFSFAEYINCKLALNTLPTLIMSVIYLLHVGDHLYALEIDIINF